MTDTNNADAYAQGSEAHAAGKPETANPYDPETDETAHLSWNDGWDAACEAASDD